MKVGSGSVVYVLIVSLFRKFGYLNFFLIKFDGIIIIQANQGENVSSTLYDIVIYIKNLFIPISGTEPIKLFNL